MLLPSSDKILIVKLKLKGGILLENDFGYVANPAYCWQIFTNSDERCVLGFYEKVIIRMSYLGRQW